jgi:hypothetical protein
MGDSQAFSLPSPIVRRGFLRFLPFVLAAVALLHLGATDRSLRELLSILALLFGTLVIGYWLARRFTWVKLTTEGLVGYSIRTPRVVISWAEPVAMRSTSYAGIPCLALYPVKGGPHVLVPVSIARSTDFVTQVCLLAPSSHPLRKAAARAA